MNNVFFENNRRRQSLATCAGITADKKLSQGKSSQLWTFSLAGDIQHVGETKSVYGRVSL